MISFALGEFLSVIMEEQLQEADTVGAGLVSLA